MSPKPRFWGLIPAAGLGRRYGGDRPKQYQVFCGRPLLAHTLERVLAWPDLLGVTLVLAENDPWWPVVARMLPDAALPPLRAVPAGGPQRHNTVWNGLSALEQLGAEPDDWVLVHDAARPAVRRQDVARLMQHCLDSGEGGTLALEVRDTLHRADAQARITHTLTRQQVYQAQTPQCFRLGELRLALGAALARGEAVTDEAAAMVAAGFSVHVLPGHWQNLKLTRLEDEPLMHWILSDGH